MHTSSWLLGPKTSSLHSKELIDQFIGNIHPFISPDDDSEVRTNKIEVQREYSTLDNGRLSDRPIGRRRTCIRKFIIFFNLNGKPKTRHYRETQTHLPLRADNKACIIKKSVVNDKKFALLRLYPLVDEYGLIPVGGSLKRFNGDTLCKNPVIIHVPAKHHVSTLIKINQREVRHQGRHLTAERVRSVGFELSVVSDLNHPPDARFVFISSCL